MAYFGRHPDKPQNLPGSASGERERRQGARLERLGRQILRGRQERVQRISQSARAGRADRAGRTAR